MKAVQFFEPGGVEVLEYLEVPSIQPQKGQVLIKIEATSINHMDIFIRGGGFPVPLPFIPGFEAAGYITDSNGTGFTNDQRVIGFTRAGAYAEFIALPCTSVFALPDEVSFELAAAAGLAYITAWGGLINIGQMEKGQKVLIQGGSSGVGIAAVQIAKMLGAWVAATTGSDEKAVLLQDIGADLVLNYNKANVLDTVLEATGYAGVDLVLEIIGTTMDTSINACKPRSRIVLAGHLGGLTTNINLGALCAKELNLIGSGTIDISADNKGHMLQQMAAGNYKPIIDSIMPLSEAAAGQARIENSQAFGKIILKP